MPTSLRVTIAAMLTALFMMPSPVRATNDPFWPQWALEKIGIPTVWQTSRGTGVVVAVVDTGVDLHHPDLQGHLLAGKDFVDGDNTPQDENGHGTHMAGTIAAVTGNGIGVASVAPEAKILPVRVLDAKGQSDDPSKVADGIRWAVDHGAKVVNLSLAQDGPSSPSPVGLDLLSNDDIDAAIKYVTSKGAVAVIAAGNTDGGGKSSTAYTATTPGAIVVGASTSDDRRAAYSNYGAGLDVLAPGGGSATDPNFERGCTPGNAVVGLYWDPSDKSSGYAGACGTSVAVAHVSGIAALLMARGYSNADAVDRIERTARDLGAKGKDAQTGWGLVDASRALGAKAPAKPASGVRSATPRVLGRKVSPAGATAAPLVSIPPENPSPAPKPTFRLLGENGSPGPEPSHQDRSVPLAIAALLALVVGFAHGEARRQLAKR